MCRKQQSYTRAFGGGGEPPSQARIASGESKYWCRVIALTAYSVGELNRTIFSAWGLHLYGANTEATETTSPSSTRKQPARGCCSGEQRSYIRPIAMAPPASTLGIVTSKKSPRRPSSNTFYPIRGRILVLTAMTAQW